MKYCVIGRHGYLGSALEKKLGKVDSVPTEDNKVIFYFASPTHVPFEKNPAWHVHTILESFKFLLFFCKKHDIKLVFPSSALVYEKDILFTQLKREMESMFLASGVRGVGLRIFPVYGVNDGRTAIYQWCKAVKEGKRPSVYGDGTQSRDFIYIDDVVDNIIRMSGEQGIMDLGVGKRTTFNKIVNIIIKEAKSDLVPKYIKSPVGYSDGIICKEPVPTKVSIKQGIRKILKSL